MSYNKQNKPAPGAVAAAITQPAPEPIPMALANFEHLPDNAFVREPVVRGLYGISHATVWRWVKAGFIPKPVKLSAQSTGWRVADLRAALRGKAEEVAA